jgi:hypothetical protein
VWCADDNVSAQISSGFNSSLKLWNKELHVSLVMVHTWKAPVMFTNNVTALLTQESVTVKLLIL